jgi:ABC-type molybdate transport system ATPase subunit
VGSTLRLKVQARDVSLALSADGASSILNRLPVRVRECRAADNPAHVMVSLDASGSPCWRASPATRQSSSAYGPASVGADQVGGAARLSNAAAALSIAA